MPDLFGVQTFAKDRKGKLAHSRFVACKAADDARKIAEDRVSGGYAVGSVAFIRQGAGEFDDGEIVILATFGNVPAELNASVPF